MDGSGDFQISVDYNDVISWTQEDSNIVIQPLRVGTVDIMLKDM